MTGRSMGATVSLCCCNKEKMPIEEQYQSLVVTKPAPVSLAKVEIDSSESDVPLFAPVDSDQDEPAVSDQETLTDTEINLYARNL